MIPNPMEVARAAWGLPLPDWIEALARACVASSQNAVAGKLDRSGALVSQVLSKTYLADTARIEQRVRGIYLVGKIGCPGLGVIPAHVCQDWRDKGRKYQVGNPTRTRMFRARAVCPRSHKAPCA